MNAPGGATRRVLDLADWYETSLATAAEHVTNALRGEPAALDVFRYLDVPVSLLDDDGEPVL